jgi:hypothetical protein
MIENLAAYSDTVKFSGSMRVETISNAVSHAQALTFTDGIYKTSTPLSQGTELRFVLGAGESAYVYAFAATQFPGGDFSSPVQLFPQAGISPLLNYSDSTIVLPGAEKTLLLDETPGMEYFVVLYAKRALDLRDIMRRFDNPDSPARVYARLEAAVGPHLLAAAALSYSETGASFTVETDEHRAVAALVVEIDHR